MDDTGRRGYPVGLIPVVMIDDFRCAARLVRALADSGATAIEITLRTPGALRAIESAINEGGLSVGVGTVRNVEDLRRSCAAGVDFAVSPGFRSDIVTEAQNLGVLAIPGVATATEIMMAASNDVKLVKFFPAAAAGGAAALRAFAEVFPDTRFMPTGGIAEADVRAYLEITSVVAVGASWLAPRAFIAEHRFAEIGAAYARASSSVSDLVS